jgi:hypothetical protein
MIVSLMPFALTKFAHSLATIRCCGITTKFMQWQDWLIIRTILHAEVLTVDANTFLGFHIYTQ